MKCFKDEGLIQTRFIPVPATLRTHVAHKNTQCNIIGSKYSGWKKADKPKESKKRKESEKRKEQEKPREPKNPSEQEEPEEKPEEPEEKPEESESWSISDDEFEKLAGNQTYSKTA